MRGRAHHLRHRRRACEHLVLVVPHRHRRDVFDRHSAALSRVVPPGGALSGAASGGPQSIRSRPVGAG
ncbi:hypothetical protein PSAC2689_90285 [Paraburkholderia sacchari]